MAVRAEGTVSRRDGNRGVTLLVLNRAQIDSLFEGDGMVVRWSRDLARKVEERAVLKAPSREGPYPSRVGQVEKLNASIRSSARSSGGGRRVIANVRAEAKHALYVHRGTQGPIFPHGTNSMLFFDSRETSPTQGTLFIIPAVEYLSKGLRAYADTFGNGRIVGYMYESGPGNQKRKRGQYHRLQSVKGQAANPFLNNAMDFVLRRERIYL